MPRLVEIESRIMSIKELGDVVGAMRALSAVRMRQALESLGAIRSYAATIGDAIARARMLVTDAQPGRSRPVPPARRSILVFCTEHGFSGAFNDQLLERAMAEAHGGKLFVVGSRGALIASEQRLDVAWSAATASHPSGVLEVARRIASELYRRVEVGALEQVDVVYGRGGVTGAPSIEREGLLPPDLSRFEHAGERVQPLHHLAAEALLEGLAGELVLAELTRMAMESLAAENAARLRAMSSARENVERKLAQLRQDEHRARQDEVTMELLDVVTGAEALRRRRS
jgi:F-type H+-transporting ATPase subunit gamma